MFEVGKHYKIVTWQPGEDGGKINVSSPSRVVDVSLPLVTFRTVPVGGVGESPDTIVNTASIVFVRAELLPDPPPVKAGKPSLRSDAQ
jgi:hypothetical protein